ncbi:MAG: tyrosine-protein phosphatase [Bacteroidales bacterium]
MILHGNLLITGGRSNLNLRDLECYGNDINFKSILNFRDAGGLYNITGICLKEGFIYRSANPDRISRKDIDKLHRLGIKTIVDLRAPGEYSKRKKNIPGINLLSLPLDFEKVTRERIKPLIVQGNQEEEIQKVINELYAEILDSAKPVLKVISQTLLSNNHTPILIHCRAGKDRTGIICALLQMIAGCQREEIADHFMESNNYLLPFFKKRLKIRKFISFGFFPAEAILDAITLRRENIELVIERVEKHYGGIKEYLYSSGLNVSDYEVLKKRLLDI